MIRHTSQVQRHSKPSAAGRTRELDQALLQWSGSVLNVLNISKNQLFKLEKPKTITPFLRRARHLSQKSFIAAPSDV